jgi:hypothetical protein
LSREKPLEVLTEEAVAMCSAARGDKVAAKQTEME